jgi:hypothetical protein
MITFLFSRFSFARRRPAKPNLEKREAGCWVAAAPPALRSAGQGLGPPGAMARPIRIEYPGAVYQVYHVMNHLV